MDQNLDAAQRVAGHVLATGTLLGYLTGVLPVIALLLTIVWYLLVIGEKIRKMFKREKHDDDISPP